MTKRNSLFVLSLLTTLAGCQQGGGHARVIERLPSPPIGGAGDTGLRAPVQPPATPRPAPIADAAPPRQRPRPEPVTADGSWAPTKGFSPRWKYIIVHHSAEDRGSPQGIAEYHRSKGWDELGYHFVIGNGVDYPDGKVFVGSRWPKQKHGAHTRVKAHDNNRWNEHGIGICLIGNFERHGATDRQLASLTRLVAYLSQQTKIPTSRIYGHQDADPHTRCPGGHFSVAALRKRVAASSGSGPVRASSN